MRLSNCASHIAASGRKALVAFLTAGYPDAETFVELVRAADRAGCDMIEIGIPFSDPIADGPVIQESSKVALDAGMTLNRALDLARELSGRVQAPLIFMSYLNPILRFGIERFAVRAVDSGVAGLIVPDLSLEDSTPVRPPLAKVGVCYVDLVAPTTGNERIARIAARAEGFIYLVSFSGVTGGRMPDTEHLTAFVARARHVTALPLYVGFGISNAEQAGAAARHADGVIIGSALIRRVGEATKTADSVASVESFLGGVRKALDAPGPIPPDPIR